MSDQTDKYLHLLSVFGLEEAEARIYLYLLEKGYQPALHLSRKLQIARTRVYRLLDKLLDKKLVHLKLEDRGMKFGATDPQKFQQIIVEREQQVDLLKKLLPELSASLQKISIVTGHNSKVLYYRGVEGLKQVSYNALKAEKILRVYEVEHISDFLPQEFSEYFRREAVKRGIMTHDLTNKKSFPEFTNVTEMIRNYSQFRYIDPQKLTISFEVLIYNDVYATYSYKEEEIFCVEIYSQELARMQKQIFDFIWPEATPLKFTSDRGAASIAT